MITRYEITATHPDGRVLLVCYHAGSPSASRLLRTIRERAEALIRALGLPQGPTFVLKARGRRATVEIEGWIVGFTGRTQLEAKSAGAHPFIGA